jgi:hypothetical protein
MNPQVTETTHSKGRKSHVARFATAGALADWTIGRQDHTTQLNWTGGETLAAARQSARVGLPSAVAAAERLLDQVNVQGIQTYRPRWQADVYGAMPDVPRYVAGAPDCMMRPDRRESESAPVRLFADCCVSAAVSAATMRARGNALLALAIKLSQCRQVELWVYADLGGHDGTAVIPMVAIPTSPLDLAAASYALTAPAFLRQLCMTYTDSHPSYTGAWAWGESPTTSGVPGAYETRLREVLGAEPEDVVLGGGHIDNRLIRQPVEWVTEQLQRYVNA